MLTDIFAYRYLERPIWSEYSEIERRLLNQAFAIAKDVMPYYNSQGNEIKPNVDKWKHQGVSQHDRTYKANRLTTLGKERTD